MFSFSTAKQLQTKIKLTKPQILQLVPKRRKFTLLLLIADANNLCSRLLGSLQWDYGLA